MCRTALAAFLGPVAILVPMSYRSSQNSWTRRAQKHSASVPSRTSSLLPLLKRHYQTKALPTDKSSQESLKCKMLSCAGARVIAAFGIADHPLNMLLYSVLCFIIFHRYMWLRLRRSDLANIACCSWLAKHTHSCPSVRQIWPTTHTRAQRTCTSLHFPATALRSIEVASFLNFLA